MLRFVHLREYSRCARFGLSSTRLRLLLRTLHKLSISRSRSSSSLSPTLRCSCFPKFVSNPKSLVIILTTIYVLSKTPQLIQCHPEPSALFAGLRGSCAYNKSTSCVLGRCF